MKSVFAAIAVWWSLFLYQWGMVPTAAAFSPQQQFSSSPPSALFGIRSTVRGAFRRGRKVLTREPDATSTEQEPKEDKQMWRLMYYDSCDYQPEGVARVLAKLIPSLDRRTAYELCSHARMVGNVPLLVTDRNNAERYCAFMLQYGLKATVEPHGVVSKKK